jgi:predicted transcriptional regulator
MHRLFESLIMQTQQAAQVAQQAAQIAIQASAAQSLVAMVVSFASVAGVIGSLVAGIAAFLKGKTHDVQVSKALSDIEDIGKLTTAFSQKTVEQQGELKTVAEVISTLSPDAKKLLEDREKDIEYWKNRSDVAQQQLSRLLALVPKEAQANLITDLAREKTPVSHTG